MKSLYLLHLTYPIIISTADGKYYISESKTATRKDKENTPYVAIADHLYQDGYNQLIKQGKAYKDILHKMVSWHHYFYDAMKPF